MSRAARARRAGAALLLAACAAAPAWGWQTGAEAERRLDTVRKELREVASERRRLEGERGAAARQLREVDEQVARSARELERTGAELERQQAELAELAGRRDALRERMGDQREELRALLRASYTAGEAAPLKLLLAQDQLADAGRALTYQRYLQRQRAERIATLGEELAGLDTLEREVTARQQELERTRTAQRAQVAALERDRAARARALAGLEDRYRDRNAREQALGRDAKALERLLSRLRAAAAKAEAERKAAAEREARRQVASPPSRTGGTTRAPAQVARAAPQVGGLGWPLSGSLLAGFGARMPDGRNSQGVLIGAATGTPVRAVADGTVVFAEWMTGYGMILIIDHGGGTLSLYAHCESLLREAGAAVSRGDAVATVGNSGGQGQPALYFELRRDGKPVNPTGFLQRH